MVGGGGGGAELPQGFQAWAPGGGGSEREDSLGLRLTCKSLLRVSATRRAVRCNVFTSRRLPQRALTSRTRSSLSLSVPSFFFLSAFSKSLGPVDLTVRLSTCDSGVPRREKPQGVQGRRDYEAMKHHIFHSDSDSDSVKDYKDGQRQRPIEIFIRERRARECRHRAHGHRVPLCAHVLFLLVNSSSSRVSVKRST